jgi:hypothetical protein
MKNIGGGIILLAAFIFVGAALSMAYIATTEYQHLTYTESRPTDPVKIEQSNQELHSVFRIGVVLGVGATLVLVIGLATWGSGYLQNKAIGPSQASAQQGANRGTRES